MITKINHFRVDTPNFLKEIIEGYPTGNAGAIRVPMNVLKGLLADVAGRCAEINDPVLNRLMFDLALYELPKPGTKEYKEIMDTVYRNEREYLEAKKNEFCTCEKPWGVASRCVICEKPIK
jgi:hypothetical protein